MGKKWCVYRHVFPNGKEYIGCTCVEPQKRWQNGYGYKCNSDMYEAIIRYGWNGIAHEIVKDNLSEQEARRLEREMIEKSDPKTLYNLELYANGRNKDKKKSYRDMVVGRETNCYDLFATLTDKQLDALELKTGYKSFMVRMSSDYVELTHFTATEGYLTCEIWEACFPPEGVTYNKFGNWLVNDAVLTKTMDKCEKMAMQ